MIDNLGPERYLLKHLKNPVLSIEYKREREIFNEIMTNPLIMDEIKKNIYIGKNILEDMERINSGEIYEKSPEYLHLKNKIINVDEYKNI